ncbi:MAG: S41 family peptidase [Bacteroidota bacterium]
MFRCKGILVFLLVLKSAVFHAQKTISNDEKRTIIERIKELIDANYVLVDRVEGINRALDNMHNKGKYTSITDFKTFAEVLSNDLIAISKDKHFLVQYRPELVKARREWRKRQEERENNPQPEKEETEEQVDINFLYGQKDNFGFEKVEILDGNVGYVKFNFFHLLDWVKPTMDAAMHYVANTDALIIDLRENDGGYTSDSYLGSYFFDDQPTLWNKSYNRTTDETTSRFTLAKIDGERYLNKPVYILVGEKTFSRAEGFAYCMKHFNKATIVGQITPGAAHGIDFLEMNDNFLIQLPVEYNIHPVTKTDWEGVGVIPHIKTQKDETLKTAHLAALEQLLQKETYDGFKKRLVDAKTALENK